MKCYPANIEHKIGFDTVRTMVAERCLSAMGRDKCAEMAFSSDAQTVRQRLEAVAEMRAAVEADDGFALSAVHDIAPLLSGIRAAGSHIPEASLMAVRSTLASIAAIESYFSRKSAQGATPYPRLDFIASRITPPVEAIRAIDAILTKTGEIKDNASPQLAVVRQQLRAAAGSISAAMRRVMARAVADGVVDADTSPSMRDGRLVIPVAPANKRRIPGIVHDESATGKTIFIEPAEVVEANNRLRELQIEERREILRVLIALADTLRPDLPQLLDDVDVLADFDFIHAKARLAAEVGGELPQLSAEPAMEWYHACHPVLQLSLQRQGKEIVPLDITLTPQGRILVISGPNAGGKSVTLKTVAVVQYMAQCGVLPPLYSNSLVGTFADIMIDIGDDQSIEDDLSTYSSHLRNMKHVLAHASARSLVLIDEFGSGTEPGIGGAIAQALLAEYTRMGLWGVITTHFRNLKQFASETPGLLNGSMLYDRQQMRPLFRLTIGTAGSSFALEIARKTGLPESIIQAASDIAGSDYVNIDRYLLDIARDRRYWENKRAAIRRREKEIEDTLERYQAEAETLHLKRREILDEARTQAQRMLDQSNAAIERAISDIRSAQAEKERTKEARRKLEQEKADIQREASAHPLLQKADRKKRKPKAAPAPAPEQAPLAVGDVVQLDGAGVPGTIMEINGTKAVVAFGMLKTTTPLARLQRSLKSVKSGAAKPSIVNASVSDSSRERQMRFSPEIDLRGMRVDEALQAVTYYIDDAIQFNAGRVRLLHGTGTGALRQAIREYLRTVPQVTSARDEDVRFGGAGITVVELE